MGAAQALQKHSSVIAALIKESSVHVGFDIMMGYGRLLSRFCYYDREVQARSAYFCSITNLKVQILEWDVFSR